MTTTNHTDEQELLQQLRRGDRSAFNQLYKQYAKPLYWKLLRMVRNNEEVEELIQDLFIKVWDKREQIIIQQSFEAYLYRMAQYMAINYIQKLKRQSRLYDEFQQRTSEIVDNIEELLEAKETQQLLDQAVAQLSEQRRKAFVLCKIEGKSHQEAAELMNISPNTVHNHLVKAVSFVKDHLEKSGKTLSPLALLLAVLPLNS